MSVKHWAPQLVENDAGVPYLADMVEAPQSGNYVRASDYDELAADLADSRAIAREQEDHHVAANMRLTEVEAELARREEELEHQTQRANRNDKERTRAVALLQQIFNRYCFRYPEDLMEDELGTAVSSFLTALAQEGT